MRRRVASSVALLAAGALAAASLSACGAVTHAAPAPPAHSELERIWMDNARRFVQGLATDLGLVECGGPTLASARAAMADENDVYTLLVAYGLFGDCRQELTNVGRPSVRERRALSILADACGKLERASALFQRAMTRHEPKALLEATAASLAAGPVLSRARAELATLATS